MSDRIQLLALLQIQGLGLEDLRWLLEAFGSPAAIFAADPQALIDEGLDPEVAHAIAHTDAELLWSLEDQLADYEATADVRFVTRDDPAYPANLLLSDEPPLFLWVRGEVRPEDARAVAVVGPWRGSPRALDNARLIGTRLAEHGYTVVSGMSAETDREALIGALASGGRAIGVLAGGMEMIEPDAQRLARQLPQQGALLSGALRPSEPPSRARGHLRDAIVAGLARAVVVVETRPEGRGVDVAVQASQAGRPMLVVQPRGDLPEGNRQLIEMGAVPVEHVRGLLEAVEQIMEAFEEALAD